MKVQATTTGGVAVISAQIGAFWALFGDYKAAQIWEAVKNVSIQDAGMAVTGLVIAFGLMIYNENKKEVSNEEN